MSFWRHARSIGPMWVLASPKAEPECRLPLVGTEVWQKGAIEIAPLLIVRDESHRLFLGGLRSRRARLRFTGCVHFAMKEICRSTDFQRTANSGLTGCLRRGVHRKYAVPGAGESFAHPANRPSCTATIRRETILNLPVKPRTVVPLDPNEFE
jgi:hypothetical protein